MSSNSANDQSVPRDVAGDVTLEREGTMFQRGAISLEGTGPKTRSQTGIPTQLPAGVTGEPPAPTNVRRNQRARCTSCTNDAMDLDDIRELIANLPSADRATILNDLKADQSLTASTTASATSSIATPIPYVDINASNYESYNIDFTKFDRQEYMRAKLNDKFIDRGIENIPKAPTLHFRDAENDPVRFLTWCGILETSLRDLGLATFVFDKFFNENTANPLEEAENSLVGGVLRPLFEDSNGTIGYISNASVYFQAVLEQYSPYMADLTIKTMVDNLDISYTCSPTTIVSTFEAIQTLQRIKKRAPMSEQSYLIEVMLKARENFAYTFDIPFNDWTDNDSTYDIYKVMKLIADHIEFSSDSTKQSVLTFRSAHETCSTCNVQREQSYTQSGRRDNQSFQSQKRQHNNQKNRRFKDKQQRYTARQNQRRNRKNAGNHNRKTNYSNTTKSNQNRNLPGTHFMPPQNKKFFPPKEGISPVFPSY